MYFQEHLSRTTLHWIPSLPAPKGGEGHDSPYLQGVGGGKVGGIQWKVFWFSERCFWKGTLGSGLFCHPTLTEFKNSWVVIGCCSQYALPAPENTSVECWGERVSKEMHNVGYRKLKYVHGYSSEVCSLLFSSFSDCTKHCSSSFVLPDLFRCFSP